MVRKARQVYGKPPRLYGGLEAEQLIQMAFQSLYVDPIGACTCDCEEHLLGRQACADARDQLCNRQGVLRDKREVSGVGIDAWRGGGGCRPEDARTLEKSLEASILHLDLLQ